MHGHADHFLSRLDRISAAETELALSLYRDPALLRQIIEIVRPDPSRERVAIPLGGDDGPFVIVTRDARFVTCLGRGMQTYDAAVVPRADLDRCASILVGLRRVIADAHRVTSEEGSRRKAFASLFTEGDRVSREDMAESLRLQPLLLTEIFEMYSSTNEGALDALDDLRFRTSFKIDEQPRLRALWQITWAVGHLTMLLPNDALVLTHHYAADGASLGEFFAAVSGTGTFVGNTALALRCHWAAAQMAPVCIDRLEEMARVRVPEGSCMAALWSLLAAGLRHPHLADRVAACLESVSSSPVPFIARVAPIILALLRKWLDRGNALEKGIVDHLRTGIYSGGARDDFSDFDDDAVMAWHASLESGLRTDRDSYPLLSILVPWFATRSAPSMYLPDALVRRLNPPWTVGTTEALIAHHSSLCKARAPRRVEASPGRNDPCPCGSAKKYKKCCG